MKKCAIVCVSLAALTAVSANAATFFNSSDSDSIVVNYKMCDWRNNPAITCDKDATSTKVIAPREGYDDPNINIVSGTKNNALSVMSVKVIPSDGTTPYTYNFPVQGGSSQSTNCNMFSNTDAVLLNPFDISQKVFCTEGTGSK